MIKKFLLFFYVTALQKWWNPKRKPIKSITAVIVLLLLSIEVFASNHVSQTSEKTNEDNHRNRLSLYNKKDIIITGVVKDKSGEPLPGATVQVKGTSISAATNTKGEFRITIPKIGTVLVFKFIGYKTQEITVTTETPLLIRLLDDDAIALNEVAIVNVGYGSVSKERLAGSVSSIKAKDIADFPVSSLAEALAGKLAGVSVTTTEGAPGAAVNVVIRGGTSITQDNSPLFIVDGFPMDNAINILNPNEIASIDVLKDVASTSIYGSRGANGVFLITTKSGRKGRTIVSIDNYAGVRKITNYLDMLDPYDFVRAQYTQNRQHYNGYLLVDTPTVNNFIRTYGNPADFDIYKSVPNVNWQARVFGRNAVSNTQSVSLNGGDEKSLFNIQLNRSNEQGIQLASGLNRAFGSLRYENQVFKGLRIGTNIRYSEQLVVGSGTSIKGSNGAIQNAARFQPYDASSNFQVNDPDANFTTAIDLSNPTTAATRDMSRGFSRNFVGNGFVNLTILPYLTFRTNLGYNVTQTDNKNFKGVANYKVTNLSNLSLYTGYPVVDLTKSNGTVINNSNAFTFSKSFKVNHRLDIVLGEELNQYDNDSFTQNIQFFPYATNWESAFANVQQANPPPGSIQNPSFTNVGGDRLLSFFGRLMYSYKSKYNLNLSFRRDGSSKFSPDNNLRWGNFPSAQFAWRVSEEQFFKKMNLSWLNGLKARVSYGTAGNNRVNGDRLYATTLLTNPTLGGYAQTDNAQATGVYSDHLANPILKWETTVSQNLGLDIDMFNSRVTASVDVYNNTTNDLLLLTNIPQQTGYPNQFQNIGSTRNRGLEIQLSGDVVRTKDFMYSVSYNMSFNRNIILKLNQLGSPNYGYAVSSGWGATEEDYYVQVGKPVGQFYGYVYDGFYTLDDFDRTVYEASLPTHPNNPTWQLKPGVVNATSKTGQLFPGKVKLKDLDGDGVITSADKTIIGNYQPKFIGGFNQNFRYKAFDMSVFVNFSYGNNTYNATNMTLSTNYQVNGNNYPAAFAQGYQFFDQAGNYITNWDQLAAANVNTKIFAPRNGLNLATSYGVEDASFLRITNISLGYSLPQKMLQRIGWLSKLRVFATVNNLYTFTKYKGYDPEASTRGNALTPGVDYSSYPRSRYILAGLNLSF